MAKPQMKLGHPMECSFCGAPQLSCHRLVISPAASICDQCIRHAADVAGLAVIEPAEAA